MSLHSLVQGFALRNANFCTTECKDLHYRLQLYKQWDTIQLTAYAIRNSQKPISLFQSHRIKYKKAGLSLYNKRIQPFSLDIETSITM